MMKKLIHNEKDKIRIADLRLPKEKRVGFMCDKCGKDLQNTRELVLNDDIWDMICMKIENRRFIPKHTLLCPECIYDLLERQPDLDDLKIAPINYWYLRKNNLLNDATDSILKHIKMCPRKSKTSIIYCKEVWIKCIKSYKDIRESEIELLNKIMLL